MNLPEQKKLPNFRIVIMSAKQIDKQRLSKRTKYRIQRKERYKAT
jgi:hypothetical protein